MIYKDEKIASYTEKGVRINLLKRRYIVEGSSLAFPYFVVLKNRKQVYKGMTESEARINFVREVNNNVLQLNFL